MSRNVCSWGYWGPRNKLPVLCWYAAERPDVVTTLIDANSEDDMLVWANRTGAQELQRGKLGVPRTY